jgi:hypothetical protein
MSAANMLKKAATVQQSTAWGQPSSMQLKIEAAEAKVKKAEEKLETFKASNKKKPDAKKLAGFEQELAEAEAELKQLRPGRLTGAYNLVKSKPKTALGLAGLGLASGVFGMYLTKKMKQKVMAQDAAELLAKIHAGDHADPVSCTDVLDVVSWHVDNEVPLPQGFMDKADGAMCATTPEGEVDEVMQILEIVGDKNGMAKIKAVLDADGLEVSDKNPKTVKRKRKSTTQKQRTSQRKKRKSARK